MIRSAIPAHLLATSAVAALVKGRVYPARVPQAEDAAGRPIDPFPCVVFAKAPRPFGAAYGNDGRAGHTLSYVRVDNLARSYTKAQEVAAATRAALEGFTGRMGRLDVSEVEVVDDYDEDDGEAGAADEAVYSSVQIYAVLHASEEHEDG